MGTKERCIYCMSDTLSGGICTNCGKRTTESVSPLGQTLPVRYMLCKQQYYLGQVLGSGGFGITYLAWDLKNDRKVAVKELFPRHLVTRNVQSMQVQVLQDQDAEFQHLKVRFQQEAQTLYELRNISEVINVYHLFEENGTAYYVMEFLEGKDLKRYLTINGRMQWSQMQESVRMILQALYAIHERKMIHRDISPDNVFLLQNGGAKLIDFGNARSYMAADPLTKILKTRFAPLEQFRDNDRQGPWTDIYSFSVTMYYALSGILPPTATERMIALKRKGRDPLQSLPLLNSEIPIHVVHAIEKGMSISIDQRYHTVWEFSEQLFPGKFVLNKPTLSGLGKRASVTILQCIRGVLKGRQLVLKPGIVETLGRQPDNSISYPSDERGKGISRHQCSFMLDNKGIVYVQDDESKYGTYLNEKRITPLKWHKVGKEDRICFAKEEYRIL